jgi:hypothetical protein
MTESGYFVGCNDAKIADPSDRYINQGKGPSFHTDEFMDGYNNGFNECSVGSDNTDRDDSDDDSDDTDNENLAKNMCIQSISLCQQLNMTRAGCPDNYYGDGYTFDLLDHSWC